jgi:hypothetical protein
MTLTERVEHFLPLSLNEFEIRFIRELYESITEKRIDVWQVEEAVTRICPNSTG